MEDAEEMCQTKSRWLSTLAKSLPMIHSSGRWPCCSKESLWCLEVGFFYHSNPVKNHIQILYKLMSNDGTFVIF